jgi:hypothetical protein
MRPGLRSDAHIRCRRLRRASGARLHLSQNDLSTAKEVLDTVRLDRLTLRRQLEWCLLDVQSESPTARESLDPALQCAAHKAMDRGAFVIFDVSL